MRPSKRCPERDLDSRHDSSGVSTLGLKHESPLDPVFKVAHNQNLTRTKPNPTRTKNNRSVAASALPLALPFIIIMVRLSQALGSRRARAAR